jgi:putative transposase
MQDTNNRNKETNIFTSPTIMPSFVTEYPQLFTATNLEWKKLLQPEKYKNIIINSLRFLVMHKRITLFAFIIMDNHVHLIWQMQPDIDPEAVQRDFLKYTAQRIKKDLEKNHPQVLASFKVDAKDREYQFWERNALSIELRTDKVLRQKLDYLHWNPVKAGLCQLPEEYNYSSALFYETGADNWGFLTHYRD